MLVSTSSTARRPPNEGGAAIGCHSLTRVHLEQDPVYRRIYSAGGLHSVVTARASSAGVRPPPRGACTRAGAVGWWHRPRGRGADLQVWGARRRGAAGVRGRGGHGRAGAEPGGARDGLHRRVRVA